MFTLTFMKNSGVEFAVRYLWNFSPNRCHIGKSCEANLLHVIDLVGIFGIDNASGKHSSDPKALISNVYNYFDELCQKCVIRSTLKRISEAIGLKAFLELYCH